MHKLNKKEPTLGDKFPEFIALHPPVFHKWFSDKFSDSQAWLTARANYTRTCAVISMAGYIVGLGDRHPMNILYDEKTGDTVHVDFNVLFDIVGCVNPFRILISHKGTKLATPERVPFRMTHNMVDAMGVYGIEGPFRRCCEITLRVLRNNKDNLTCVLESFTHDPLVEWAQVRAHGQQHAAPKLEGKRVLDVIKRKLEGSYLTSMPCSVEAQVSDLITVATSQELLSKMYIGTCSS